MILDNDKIKIMIDTLSQDILHLIESGNFEEINELLDKREMYLKKLNINTEKSYLIEALKINQVIMEKIIKEKDQLQEIILNIGHMQDYNN